MHSMIIGCVHDFNAINNYIVHIIFCAISSPPIVILQKCHEMFYLLCNTLQQYTKYGQVQSKEAHLVACRELTEYISYVRQNP